MAIFAVFSSTYGQKRRMARESSSNNNNSSRFLPNGTLMNFPAFARICDDEIYM